MPERLRSIVARLREYVADRRRSPRFRVRLACAVSLYEPDEARRAPAQVVTGYTRDLSASGLAIVLPAVRIGERYLTAAGTTLRIQLAHQTGALELLATTVFYDQLSAEAEDKGFLVGLRIVEMNETDRARYEAVISQYHPQ